MHRAYYSFIYYLSFAVFLLITLTIYEHQKFSLWFFLFTIIGSAIFLWTRFIEPHIIITRHTKIDVGFPARIVLISDLHLGAYKGKSFVKRVVRKINKEKADYVLIAGDFTFYPNISSLKELFAPLKGLQVPAYGVLGNHDVEKPGPRIRKELVEALAAANVKLLNNDTVRLPNFTLVGLGDHRNEEDDVSLLEDLDTKENVVVLTHDPDTTLLYSDFCAANLTMCGHTHGGQIRIPWLYKFVIPDEGPFDRGLTQERHTKLYVSSGLGEVSLPMRFLNPPVIDVLEVY